MTKRATLLLLSLLTLLAAAPASGAATLRPGGKMYLSFENDFRSGHSRLTFTNRAVRVVGTLAPYVPHQRVEAKVYRGRRAIIVRHLSVRPSHTGRVGHFSFRVVGGVPGRLKVVVVHGSSSTQRRVAARPADLLVYRPYLSYGARGPLAGLFLSRLRRIGYPASPGGVYDSRTGRAVLAYRKTNGFSRISSADSRVISLVLAGRGAFRARYPNHGRHVEADLSRQVLVLLDGRHVHAVYPTSSGKPSTPTVLGSFRFYRKEPGTNSHGMVHSSYFIRGYAIHGYASVPTYAASHGCLRIPIPDARTVFDWVRIGYRIDVYP